MIKTFVIDTLKVEHHIYAMDLTDALNTFDGKAEDIICIKEYENYSEEDTLH
jgi:hypothetical protein